MQAHEIMTRRPVTGTPQMPLRRAQTVLRRGRFRHLPILEAGRLSGVLSDRDLQRALAAGLAADAPVAPLVRGPAITAAPDTPVEVVAGLLGDNKIGCVPIVEVGPGGGETLVGIVTESDVFAAYGRALGIAGPGSPLTVRLADPPADLTRLGRALAGCAAPLLALATEPLPPGRLEDPGPPRLRLTLRLGTINPAPVRAALVAAGLDVEGSTSDAGGGTSGTGGAGGGGLGGGRT